MTLPSKPGPPEHSPPRALTRASVVRVGTLVIGAGGTAGGALLLAVNLAGAAAAGWGSIPWVPISANAALLFGGVMFLREHRRRARDAARRDA